MSKLRRFWLSLLAAAMACTAVGHAADEENRIKGKPVIITRGHLHIGTAIVEAKLRLNDGDGEYVDIVNENNSANWTTYWWTGPPAGTELVTLDATGHLGTTTIASAGGAASTEPFVTVGNTAGLSGERAITEGLAIDLTDAGANSSVTVAFDPGEVGDANWGSNREWTFGGSVEFITGQLQVRNGHTSGGSLTMQQDLDFSSNFTGWRPPVTSLPRDLIYSMPSDDPADGEVLTWHTSDELSWDAPAGGTAYDTVQEEGSDLTQRDKLNFVGSSFTAADDAGNTRTNVTADSDLNAIASNSTDGLWAHTGAGTGSARTLQAPAAGLTISNPAGVAGDPTLALANDLSAVEGLSGTGFAKRTGTDAWALDTTVVTTTTTASRREWLGTKEVAYPVSNAGSTVVQLGITNGTAASVMQCDDAVTDYGIFAFQFPDNYDGGTVTYTVHWITKGAGSGSVVFGGAGECMGDGVAFDTAFGTEVTVTDATASTAAQHRIAATSGAVTFAGTPAASKTGLLRLGRLGGNGSDTYADSCYVIGVELEFGINAYSE